MVSRALLLTFTKPKPALAQERKKIKNVATSETDLRKASATKRPKCFDAVMMSALVLGPRQPSIHKLEPKRLDIALRKLLRMVAGLLAILIGHRRSVRLSMIRT